MKKIRGYIFSRPFNGERVPQHVQNLVIRSYCESNNLEYLLSATEYAMPFSHLILEEVIAELIQTDICGVVLYSLFQLPEDSARREKIYEIILKYKKNLYFAVEGLKASDKNECEKIETLWKLSYALRFSESGVNIMNSDP